MKPTLFLDIDGVLATPKEFVNNQIKFWKKNQIAEQLRIPYPFNPGCVKIFNEIIGEVDFDIVLSSDWKTRWTINELDQIFKFNGVVKSPIDKTEIHWFSFQLEKNRSNEIEMYVKQKNIENFLVVDDLPLGEFIPKGHFIKTIEWEGLKQTGIKEKIIKILKEKNPD